MRSAGYHEKMIGRTYFGGDQVTQLNLVLYNTIKWPYILSTALVQWGNGIWLYSLRISFIN